MYVDPGSGSVILQAVLAAVLGIGVFTRVFWKKIKGLFGKKEPTEDVYQEKED